MLRRYTIVSAALSLVLCGAGVAPAATYFVDLSGLAGNTVGLPTSVNSSGAVTGQAYGGGTPSTSHVFLYTGGSAGTMNDLTALGTIPSTAKIGTGINNSGQMSAFGFPRGYCYTGGTAGTATEVLWPGYTTGGLAYGIDTAGDVTGMAIQPTTFAHVPFLRTNSDGAMYNLGLPSGPPGAEYDSAISCSLSPRGGLAGGCANLVVQLIPAASAATVWQYSIAGGVMTSAGIDIRPYLPGYSPNQPQSLFNTSFVVSINDAGQAVGETAFAYGAPESDANDTFIYDAATHAATSLGALGLRFPYVNPQLGLGLSRLINNEGQVVGKLDVGGAWHAAIWDSNNGLRDLNTLYGPSGANILPAGFILNAATAINESGYIVGYGTDSAGHTSQVFLISAPTLPGDANLDGVVDISDLSKVLTNYDKTGMHWADGDFNADGTVNITDLSNVLTNYDKTAGASAGIKAVPEPGTITLLLAGAISLLAYDLRRRERGA